MATQPFMPLPGGLHLPTFKTLSASRPLAEAPLPAELVFPLQLRGGINAVPTVSAGQRVLKGEVIARAAFENLPPLHASSSGIVRCIENRLLPHPSAMEDLCIIIDTDGLDEALPLQPRRHFSLESRETLRAWLIEAGVLGLGGAAFPTGFKVDPGKRRVDTLILNAAECEPYITCDDSLLQHFPHEVLQGAIILMHILSVEQCIIGIEDDMPEACRSLENALRARAYSGIRLQRVPALYPSGGEKQLIQILTGREVPAGGIPADIGIVCQNVGTAGAVYRAIEYQEPLVSRIVTVTGHGIHEPRNWITRIGTPIAHLTAASGGYTNAAERLIIGGPMMGFAVSDDQLPVTKASNCILVAGHEDLPEPPEVMPCIRCGACAEVCPAGLLPQQLYWYGRADNQERLEQHELFSCIECGCCNMVCPSHIPLVQHFRASKGKLTLKRREREKADHARVRFESRQSRKEEEKRSKAEATRRKREALNLNTPEVTHTEAN
ncbi:MAG: hypothetical protein RIQ52_1294 [Pseudomonadota bacterium]|jgi:electron transport complex protein RnfC